MSRVDCMVLLASAGTGKTFQLTNRLLRLYASDVNPRKILASTFTRKAAGEILERLIERLCAACESEEACAKLGREIGVELDRANAIELTSQLLRRIDRLRISTLDAWFQERVQAASFELGLPGDWEISDPELERRMYARALSRALDRPRTRTEWTTLISDLKRGGAESRVHAGMLASLGAGARFARECTPDAWDFPAPLADVDPSDFARARVALERLEVPLNKSGKPRRHYANAQTNLARCADEQDWTGFAKLRLVERVLDGTLVFDSTGIPPEWAECVRMLAQRAAHRTARVLCAQNAAMRSLVGDFLQELDLAMRLERRMSFDELPRLLAARTADSSAEVDHLLLDEFQDTSRLQWRALERGVEAMIDLSDASFFCVGDVKQSIYAWRDGNPLLLAQLGQRLSLPSQTLALNFRSSAAVLDFVNQVFEDIARNDALKKDAAALAASRQFEAAFERHHPDKQLEGRVRLWFGPKIVEPQVKPREDARLERGVALALELQRAHPEWTLAFLLRKKKLVPALLERLKREGLQASGEGGNPLTDSSAVNAALSLLEFADHPADDYLAFHLETSPLAGFAGLSPQASRESRVAASRALLERWIAVGAAGILAELEPLIARNYGAFDQRRFAQLLALAQRLEPSEPLRPAQFAARLANERVPDPASSRIQVMTVHGAKGREFDAVILLDLDQPLNKGGDRGLVALRRDGDPRAAYDVVTHTLCNEEALLIPELHAVQIAAKSTRILEELCILYVALTRAVHHIELVVDFPGENLAKTSFAGILLQGLGVDRLEPSSVVWDDQWGEPLSHAEGVAPPRIVPEPRASAPIALLAGNSGLGKRAPSDQGAGAARATLELFQSDSARRRGLLWHAWLEGIEWSEDTARDPATLLARARELGFAWAESRDAVEFMAALAQPQVQHELSRAQSALRLSCEPGDLRLLRELRFAFVREAPSGRELVSGALDRAIVSRTTRRAAIVDFKTDQVASFDEAAMQERARSYRPQLELYRNALARLEQLDEAAIAMRICFVQSGRTIELEA
ncbi:MAG TPA: UvrD-helicase domain-containing protein [Planctomycetota bacterium]|nr:UvrD-helicase domain-containing protein [Planctomycetota bacterium]